MNKLPSELSMSLYSGMRDQVNLDYYDPIIEQTWSLFGVINDEYRFNVSEELQGRFNEK